MLLNDKHRHKLIDGLVIAMGKPVGKPSPSGGSAQAEDVGGSVDEGSPEEETAESPDEETSEGMKCARDLSSALGIDDIDDTKARAIVEAIKTIAGGYKQ